MGEMTPEIPVGQGESVEGGSEQIQMNPAWNDALSVVPSAFHSQLAPVFQKWDQGVQAKLDEANTKYAGFNTFLENGVTPEILAGAMHLAESLQRDPRGMYDAIGSHYNFAEQVQEAIEEMAEENPLDPRIQELNDKFAVMAKIMLDERQQAEKSRIEKEAEAEFDAALKAVAEKYGDKYDEDKLLQIMQGNTDPMKAMETLLALSGQGEQPKPPSYAPPIMGSGGQIPVPIGGNKPLAALSSDEIEDVMASMLRAGKAQRQGY